MTVAEQQVIQEQLSCGAITWEKALEAITGDSKKPWHTKEWQEKREPLIKAQCDQCATDQGPMVLHHLRSPMDFADLRRFLRAQLWEFYKEQHPLQIEEPVPVDRVACPRCHSTNITQMKTGDKHWKCHFQSRGRRCGHEFSVPGTVKALSPQQKQERSGVWRAKSNEVYQEFCARYDAAIATEAVIRCIDEHIHYMSMDNTATFCKKCAFLWDMKHMQLCQRCRLAYHALGQRSCVACDEDYVLCVVCGERQHQKAYSACFTCNLLGRQVTPAALLVTPAALLVTPAALLVTPAALLVTPADPPGTAAPSPPPAPCPGS